MTCAKMWVNRTVLAPWAPDAEVQMEPFIGPVEVASPDADRCHQREPRAGRLLAGPIDWPPRLHAVTIRGTTAGKSLRRQPVGHYKPYRQQHYQGVTYTVCRV